MSGSKASSRGGSPSICERLSPVLITRSGRNPASECMNSLLRACPGIMCISEMCRIRRSAVPAGRTGSRSWRTTKLFSSIKWPYAAAATPRTAPAATVFFSTEPVRAAGAAARSIRRDGAESRIPSSLSLIQLYDSLTRNLSWRLKAPSRWVG